MLLKVEIAYIVYQEKIRTFDNDKNIVYDKDELKERSEVNDNLQNSRRLQDTELESEREKLQHREIWSYEVGLPKEQEETFIRANENQGYTSRTPIGDRYDSRDESEHGHSFLIIATKASSPAAGYLS